MKINEHIVLSTSSVLLVPYSKHHVPTYHKWMQDPELQAATASEPLSMEEEYAMQSSWRTDHDKLTFIICKAMLQTSVLKPLDALANMDDCPDHMLGDINLFLFPSDDEDEAEQGTVIGEIELMIARKDWQRKGYGRASLLTFLDYILGDWTLIGREYSSKDDDAPKLEYLRVKINESNVGSIRLFESVGFERIGEGANYFGEVELRWQPDVVHLQQNKEWEKVYQLKYRVETKWIKKMEDHVEQ